jgi:hypothetical protein
MATLKPNLVENTGQTKRAGTNQPPVRILPNEPASTVEGSLAAGQKQVDAANEPRHRGSR